MARSEASEGTSPAHSLTRDHQPPELREQALLVPAPVPGAVFYQPEQMHTQGGTFGSPSRPLRGRGVGCPFWYHEQCCHDHSSASAWMCISSSLWKGVELLGHMLAFRVTAKVSP